MGISLFKGKPIEKLIETVSAGIGVLYEPTRIRKKADAESYRLERIQEAKAKGLILMAETQNEIVNRTNERLAHQEITRQSNLEEIIEKSVKHLDEQVSSEPVDADWRTRFFNKAQDVTNEEMQEVWAKILAEEIKEPGKISLRTIEVVSNLTKYEASIFEALAKIAFNEGFVVKIGSKDAFDKYDINFTKILVLRDAGLLFENDNLHITFEPKENGHDPILNFGQQKLLCVKVPAGKIEFQILNFTTAGTELLNILNVAKNPEYLNEFIADQKRHNIDIQFCN